MFIQAWTENYSSVLSILYTCNKQLNNYFSAQKTKQKITYALTGFHLIRFALNNIINNPN